MQNKNIILVVFVFFISLFFSHCGGKYEPEIVPKVPVKINTVPREREAPIDENEFQNVDMKPVQTEEIKVEDSSSFQRGVASWYGGKFHGRRTANGEIYDKHKLTAAHKTLPFNTIVEVTNLENQKKIIVRINDRGPFVKNRIIDLSKKAAEKIDMEDTGTAPVLLKILNKKSLNKTHKTEVFSNTIRSEKAQWFYVQAGAFKEKINAEKTLDKIKRITEVSFSIKNDNGLYKVISEKLSPRSQAEKVSSSLKEYYIDTFVKTF